MKFHYVISCIFISLIVTLPIWGQNGENCFLVDFQPKNATIPPYQDSDKPSASPTVTVTVNCTDTTIGNISKYIFGNALAAWVGNDAYNPVLVGHLQNLAPTLIRYPGGSWADIFFWNGDPGDLPSTIPDGTNNGTPIPLSPQYGMNSWPTTVDNYYNICWDVDTQGLITINYGYARYGLSANPVEQAAHFAADWVRYDDGRTKFWEIGNENAGPWEAGWQIDTTTNLDGQPEIITGELYGQHFNIIADSMRAAASELDNTIYIGGQILHYDGTNSWNIADRQWNEGFFRQVGDNADFYVIHNYIGTSTNARTLLNEGSSVPSEMINFIHQDISQKQASLKPVAITEWNMHWDAGDLAKTSIINGMQAVIVFCELIKLKYGMSTRWLIANWESDGMFYRGNNSSIPDWNPRPAFFYCYYLQKFTGDHALTASTFYNSIVAYASTFNSGETGVVIVNKGTLAQVVRLLLQGKEIGDHYYIYSLTGGTDNGDFSQVVYVNDIGPSGAAWGPIDYLDDLPAQRYTADGEIKFNSPARSVQFILIEPSSTSIPIDADLTGEEVCQFNLSQNYPNPFNPTTVIKFSIPTSSTVDIDLYTLSGQKIGNLTNENYPAGTHQIKFNGENLSSGVYLYRIKAGNFVQVRKMILMK